MRPLLDGTVAIDGVAPVFMALEPEEIFFRAFRHAEFDIAELSLSSFTVRTAWRQPYVGVPAFPSRAFQHSGIHIRTGGINAPTDLKGRRVGLAEYQLTANPLDRGWLDPEIVIEEVAYPDVGAAALRRQDAPRRSPSHCPAA